MRRVHLRRPTRASQLSTVVFVGLVFIVLILILFIVRVAVIAHGDAVNDAGGFPTSSLDFAPYVAMSGCPPVDVVVHGHGLDARSRNNQACGVTTS
jgi:hypothetical protein